MLITGKKQYACDNLTSSCFVLVASKTASAVLDSFGLGGNKEGMLLSFGIIFAELLGLDVDNGIVQSVVE